MRNRALFGVVILAALLAAGCNGGDSGGDPTPTPPPGTGGPTVSVSPTAPPDIRQEDFSQHPVMQDYLDSAGGEVATAEITYADLTGDGYEEAIVPVASGGEGGNIAIFVFGYGEGGLAALLKAEPQSESITSEVVDAKLVTSEPVYGPDDPLCCPSQLRSVTYSWNGTDLVETNVETAPNEEPAA